MLASSWPTLDSGNRLTPSTARVTYQDACHLAHAQRVTRQPRDLLRQIPGVELVEMREADFCCGSAGIYNVLRPEMAGRLRSRKVDNIQA